MINRREKDLDRLDPKTEGNRKSEDQLDEDHFYQFDWPNILVKINAPSDENPITYREYMLSYHYANVRDHARVKAVYGMQSSARNAKVTGDPLSTKDGKPKASATQTTEEISLQASSNTTTNTTTKVENTNSITTTNTTPQTLSTSSDVNTTGATNETSEDDQTLANDETTLTQNGVTATTETIQEEDPRDKERPLIDVKHGLTPAQKELFCWDDTVKTFRAVNRVDGHTLRQWEFNRWVCIALKEGWKEGDPVPNAREVVQKETKNGHPVYYALNYNLAFAHARKNSPTGKFYFVNNITGYALPYASGTGLSSASAYKNFQLNKDKHVDFKKIADFVGPSAKGALDKLNAIKAYNDKLLSDDFVEIVYNAQLKIWPEKKDKVHWTGIWNAETESKFNSYDSEQLLKQKAAEKKIADQKKYDATIGYADVEGIRRYVIDGINRYVETAVLDKLRKTILTDYTGADEVLEDYKPGNPQWKKDLAYMLTVKEREKILAAYYKEWDVDEEEEEVITLILGNVPNDQMADPALKQMLKSYEDKGLKDWIDYNHNIADYQTARESITGEVDKSAITETMDYVDFADDAEDAAEDLNAKIPKLSAKQIQAFSLYNRFRCLDIFLQESGPNNAEDWNYFDKLFINVQLSQVPSTKGYLEKDNYIKFVRLRDRMIELLTESQRKVIEETLESWYAKDSVQLTYLINMQAEYRKFVYLDEENHLYALPQNVYAQLSEMERMNLYKRIIWRGSETTSTYGGKIIIKILGTVGANAKTEEERTQQRQAFYDKLSNSEDIGFWHSHHLAIDDEEERKIDRTLNSLDAKGRADRAKEVLDVSFDSDDDITDSADYEIAKLSDEDLMALTLAQRKKMIEAMIGRGFWENLFTRVGGEDEETVLRIIASTPDADMNSFMIWMGKNSGEVFSRIEFVMNGASYDKLHAQFKDKKMASIEAEKDPVKKLEKEKEIRAMQTKKSGDSIPWDKYSYLGLVFFSSGIEYETSWTEEGKIKLKYSTRDWKDMYLGPTVGVVRGAQSYFDDGRDYDPYAWVAMYSVEDDDEMGLKEGEVSVIPAINLLRMSYKQDVDHVWELVDILSLAIGIGEIKAAVSIGRWVIAAIDILLSAGNMMARTFGHLMPEGWVAMWHEFSMVVGTFQLLNAGMAAVRNYKAILQGLKDGVMAVKNTLTAVAFSAMMRFMKLDEELLTLTETILTTRDMKWLNRLLDDLEKEKTAMGAERYNNIKKAAEDRLAVLEGEAQLEQKLAKERKAADELEGADVGARGKKSMENTMDESIRSREIDIENFNQLNRASESRKVVLENNLSQYAPMLDLDELTAIHRYTVNNFELSIAAYSEKGYSAIQQGWVNLINSGLDKMRSVYSYTKTVYRGSNLLPKHLQPFIDAWESSSKSILQPNFLSCTKLKSVAQDFIQRFKEPGKIEVVFEITPKSGVYIDDISDYGKHLQPSRHPNALVQEEVILRNNGMYEITSLERNTSEGKEWYLIKMTEQ